MSDEPLRWDSADLPRWLEQLAKVKPVVIDDSHIARLVQERIEAEGARACCPGQDES